MPQAVVAHQPAEGGPVQALAGDVHHAGQDGAGRAGQQPGRFVAAARGAGRAEPVAGDDAEVAAATAGVGPPQLAQGALVVAGGDDGAGVSAGVDDHDLDGVQVVGGEAEGAGERAVAAAGDVSAEADGGAGAAGQGDAPSVVELAVHVHQAGPGLHHEGAPPRVVGDGVHRGEVEDDADGGVADDVLEAVAAAAHGDPLAGAYGVVDGGDDVGGGGGEPERLRVGGEAFVAAAGGQCGVARVAGVTVAASPRDAGVSWAAAGATPAAVRPAAAPAVREPATKRRRLGTVIVHLSRWLGPAADPARAGQTAPRTAAELNPPRPRARTRAWRRAVRRGAVTRSTGQSAAGAAVPVVGGITWSRRDSRAAATSREAAPPAAAGRSSTWVR